MNILAVRYDDLLGYLYARQHWCVHGGYLGAFLSVSECVVVEVLSHPADLEPGSL